MATHRDPDMNHATSNRTCGFFAAIDSSVRAAPDGARRPCSQSCNVRTETPSSIANCACERPVRSRIAATEGRFTTPPISPRLSSRKPSRTSSPMSRRDVDLVCPDGVLVFDFISDLPQNMGGNGSGDVFRIKRQQPDLALPLSQEINDANSTSLATAGDAPAHFPHAAGPANDFALLRASRKGLLQSRIVIVGQVFIDQAREQPRFHEADHLQLYGIAVVGQYRNCYRDDKFASPTAGVHRPLD